MRGLHQGERLLLLANRSGKSRTEIANNLNIHPGHLSKLFKSEILTSKIKRASAALFNVDIDFFHFRELDDANELEEIKPRDTEEMTAAEVLRYLEEKDRRFDDERIRHHEERARLLGIIENLTVRKQT